MTLMPVSAIRYLVNRLGTGASSFPALVPGAEEAGAVFSIDVKPAGPHAFRRLRGR